MCKPDLGQSPELHHAPNIGAPKGCHMAPFPCPNARRFPKLRPSSTETGPMGPEGRVSESYLRVSEGCFLEGWRGTTGVWRG